jgi:hypothetical protein
MKRSSQENKATAKELFMLGWSQTRIASVLVINEATISKWAKSENWAKLRADQFSVESKVQQQIFDIYTHQVEAINAWCVENPGKVLEKGTPDGLYKMYSIIKVKSASWAQVTDTVKDLVEFIASQDPDLAKTVFPIADQFIVEKKKLIDA